MIDAALSVIKASSLFCLLVSEELEVKTDHVCQTYLRCLRMRNICNV